MVAKIVNGRSIRGLMNYNENKVSEGQAQLIMASRFGGDLDQLSFNNKLARFEHLTLMNSRVKTNAMHIMLNFDTTEQVSVAKMQEITAAYMDKIGFGDQPYLVYQHRDAAHPHIHVVTTNIKADGKRINIHNIGKTLSESARKELEQEYNLVKAEGHHIKESLGITPANLEKAVYGKTPTKRAITNVVTAVTQHYKFTSLPELNAVLKLFNVIADRGKEDTIMFQKKGLIYSILDDKGKKIGIPFKASALAGKPTLMNLEKKFTQNEEKRKPFRENLKTSIDNVLMNYAQITKGTFEKELQKQNIYAIFRQNEQSYTYGVTFVDNNNKTVFNGSDLGKAYGAKALTAQFNTEDKPLKQSAKSYLGTGEPKPTYLKPMEQTSYLKKDEPTKEYLQPSEFDKLLQNLMGKQEANTAPLTQEQKRKKKRGQHL
ncbi:relaxase/mobilization nuclease domain-containing protein [Mucilaginibacter sp.]